MSGDAALKWGCLRGFTGVETFGSVTERWFAEFEKRGAGGWL